MEPTPLERAVLEHIATARPDLREALEGVNIVDRTYTGKGSYTDFAVSSEKWDSPPVSGPTIKSSALEHGAGSLLWLLKGSPVSLEMFAYGDLFPERIDEFALS